jgi:general secretion pathway protein I
MTANHRMPDAGFTLIETLVALAVLAMSAVALLATTQAHIARIAGLEARAAAMWVAENHLAEVSLGLMPAPAASMLGFDFVVSAEATATTDPDVQQLVITAMDATDNRSLARLTGFVLTDGAGPAP